MTIPTSEQHSHITHMTDKNKGYTRIQEQQMSVHKYMYNEHRRSTRTTRDEHNKYNAQNNKEYMMNTEDKTHKQGHMYKYMYNDKVHNYSEHKIKEKHRNN